MPEAGTAAQMRRVVLELDPSPRFTPTAALPAPWDWHCSPPNWR
jgi:hypothetical protein